MPMKNKINKVIIRKKITIIAVLIIIKQIKYIFNTDLNYK